jgi:tight adherence protein C
MSQWWTMPPVALWIGLTGAIAVAALSTCLLRITSQVPHTTRASRLRLPLVLWGTGRTGEIIGYFAMPAWPGRIVAVWSLRLRQAEFDREVTVQQWLGARLLYAACLCVMTAVVLGRSQLEGLTWYVAAGTLGFWLPGLWLRDLAASRRAALLKDLPAYLDIFTLAVEAGGSLTGALRIAVEKAPPTILRRVLERVLADIRAGRSRMEALEAAAAHFQIAPLTAVTSALVQAETAGMSLGAVLRAQAEQRLNERFAAAEKLALQAPVKMLGPLILCIFPCTFIVIGFPIAVRLLGGLDT